MQSKFITIFTLLAFYLFAINSSISAQVTLGTTEKPIEGALLQLKNLPQTDDNNLTNATKGLMMPRVLLTKKYELLPMFSDDLENYNTNKPLIDKEHTGLLVYNTQANAEEILCKGMNVWNGTEWQCLNNKSSYTIDCNSVKPKGVYWNEQTVNPNQHYLIMDLITKDDDVGKFYHIKTDAVDGISFEGKGLITQSGKQTVHIPAEGTPTNTRNKYFTITTNSTANPTCSFILYIVIPQKRILSLGTGNRALHQNSGGGTGTIFNNTLNFGTHEESTFRVETPIIYGFDESHVRVNTLQPYIAPTDGSKPVDIVFVTYNADLVSSNNNAAGKLLAEYVRKGGVVIYNNEHMFSHNSGAPGKFIQDLFGGDANVWGKENITDGGCLYKLPNYDDIILNGPFGDVRGMYIGEDGCCGDGFDYLPASEIEWSFSSFDHGGAGKGGREDQISGFKAKNYNLFWCGDGGIDSGNGGDSYTSYPVSLDSEFRPIDKLYGAKSSNRQYVKNARFVANLFCWAFQQAEFHGINTPTE